MWKTLRPFVWAGIHGFFLALSWRWIATHLDTAGIVDWTATCMMTLLILQDDKTSPPNGTQAAKRDA